MNRASDPGKSGNHVNPWLQGSQALLDESMANLHRLARIPLLWQRSQRVRKRRLTSRRWRKTSLPPSPRVTI